LFPSSWKAKKLLTIESEKVIRPRGSEETLVDQNRFYFSFTNWEPLIQSIMRVISVFLKNKTRNDTLTFSIYLLYIYIQSSFESTIKFIKPNMNLICRFKNEMYKRCIGDAKMSFIKIKIERLEPSYLIPEITKDRLREKSLP
jgi:hypothetical protein